MDEVKVTVYRSSEDVERMRASLPQGPPATATPVMVVVSGLPGSGKSYFSRRLVEQVPLLVLESDVLRKVLFPSPSYTSTESTRLFSSCHSLIRDLLKDGVSILLDATNLVEGHRERLYNIADQLGVKLLLVYLKAPPGVVRERLKGRALGLDAEDSSGADWQVYEKLSVAVEPIKRNHFVVDTGRDISPAIANVVQEINRWTRAPR